MSTTPNNSPAKHLSNLIAARYGAIAINSSEEARVMRALCDISQQAKQYKDEGGNIKTVQKQLWSWDSTTGLQLMTCDNGDVVVATNKEGRSLAEAQFGIDPEAMRNPLSALEEILYWNQRHPSQNGIEILPPCIFVVKDIAPLMITNAGEYRIPEYARAIRNVAQACTTGIHTLVLLNPSFKLPSELEKDLTIYEFPLPTRDELAKVVDDALDNPDSKVRRDLNGTKEELVSSLSGLTQLEAENVLSMAIVSTGKLDSSAIDFVLEEKAQIIKKSGIAEFYRANVKDGDIGGLENLKAYLVKRRAAFSAKAREFGLDAPRGLLLVGFPGTGKSLVAKAITGGKMPLLRVDVGALFGSLLGDSEANVRKLFRLADAVSPCTLWFDEIEKGIAGMTGGSFSTNNSARRMFGTILTWMQEHTTPVDILATSNDIGQIAASAPELLRRFDAMFFTDLPTVSERSEIVSIHLKKVGRDPKNFDVEQVSANCDKFTGDEIRKLVQQALSAAFAAKRDLTTADLLNAKAMIVPVANTMRRGIEELRQEWIGMGCLPASQPNTETRAPQSGSKRKIELN